MILGIILIIGGEAQQTFTPTKYGKEDFATWGAEGGRLRHGQEFTKRVEFHAGEKVFIGEMLEEYRKKFTDTTAGEQSYRNEMVEKFAFGRDTKGKDRKENRKIIKKQLKNMLLKVAEYQQLCKEGQVNIPKKYEEVEARVTV